MAHKQRVAEVLGDPESSEKRRSRESLTADSVKYESGPDGGEEVSMGVEWSGVSTVRSPPPPHSPVHHGPAPLQLVPAELVHVLTSCPSWSRPSRLHWERQMLTECPGGQASC